MAKEKANKFFTENEQHKIVQAIREWEKDTSGEIKLHIENECKADVVKRAQELFQELDLKTKNSNAVLIYLAVQSHTFAVIGDAGIHSKVEPGFWNSVAWLIEEHFKDELYLVGALEAIKLVGTRLVQFFPASGENDNEIPNDISFA